MEEKGVNVSLIVATFFFIVFSIFLLFGYHPNITGHASLENINTLDNNFYYVHDVISGEINLKLNSTDNLDKTKSKITIKIFDSSNTFVDDKILALDNIFGNTISYSGSGTYTFDISEFNLIIYDPGLYTLNITFLIINTTGESEIQNYSTNIEIKEKPQSTSTSKLCDTDSDCASDEYCPSYSICQKIQCESNSDCTSTSAPYCNDQNYKCNACDYTDASACDSGLYCSPYKGECYNTSLPEIYEVYFFNDPTSASSSYGGSYGDQINCYAYYNNKGTLSGSIIKPGDSPSSPTKTFRNSDFECYYNCTEDFVCDVGEVGLDPELNETLCGITYTIQEAGAGQWGCRIEASNENGTDFAFGTGSIIISSSPPTLEKEIENISLTESLSNEVINLNNYFDDPDGDRLIFTVKSKPDNLIINIDPLGNVGIRANQSTSGSIIFLASDGTSEIESNSFSVDITLTACIEDWSCTPWDLSAPNEQTRKCIDRNHCGTTSTKPSEKQVFEFSKLQGGSQDSVNQEPIDYGKKINWPVLLTIIALLIGLLIIVSLVGVFAHLKKKKELANEDKKPLEQIKKVEKTEQPPKTISSQPLNQNGTSKEHISKITRFVEQKLKNGESKEEIEKKLKSVGWEDNGITKSFQIIDLKKFVNGKLDEGYDKETIKKSLLNKGWKQDIIDHVFS